MPAYDVPITTDDRDLKNVLAQKQPVLLVLFDGKQTDKPLDDAINREAHKHAGQLLIVRVDGRDNPDTMAKYQEPALPALVTLTPSFFGRKVKSSAEKIRPSDVRSHIAHLLDDKPLPEEKKPAEKSNHSGKKNIVVATDRNFKQEVLRSKIPVLVDFWAPWCGPCHNIAPYVEQVAGQMKGRLKVAKLNTDDNRQIAAQFGIQSIPTFIMFQGGQQVGRFSGANPMGIQRLISEVVIPE
jgi:thioredoxin 1